MGKFVPPLCLVVAAATLLFCLWLPIHSRLTVVSSVFAVVVVLGVSGFFLDKLRPWLSIFPLVFLIPFVLPGSEFDRPRLRSDVVDSIRALEGTRYVWGGESGRGIDCSGLPRLALRRALLKQGWGGNGRAFRAWLDLWWNDASAKAMADGHRDWTVAVGAEGKIPALDPRTLLPGDLAVTRSGVHVLVFLGNGEWAQADPKPAKV